MVRAVELKLKRVAAGEREGAMDMDDADGYVVVRPLFAALGNFERSEPSMKLYFPEMVRSIDTNAEAKRIQSIKFTPAGVTPKQEETAAEEVARRRRLQPSTIPNHSEAIAPLTQAKPPIPPTNPRAP